MYILPSTRPTLFHQYNYSCFFQKHEIIDIRIQSGPRCINKIIEGRLSWPNKTIMFSNGHLIVYSGAPLIKTSN
uniref:Uncharacterized protein n=1 Tax=Populus trichocarpa TaxID=3694 RepID=A0A2K2CAI7_POPTR